VRGRPDVLTGGPDDDEAPGPPRSRLVIAAGVAAVVLLGALVVALLQDGDSSGDNPLAGTPSAGDTGVAPSTGTTNTGTDTGETPGMSPMPSGPSGPPESVATVVERFTKAWMLHAPAERRRKALTPVASTSLVEGLALTDVSLLPPDGTRPDGEPSLRSATPSQGIYLQRLTDGESILVTAADFGSGRWLVVDVQPGPESEAG